MNEDSSFQNNQICFGWLKKKIDFDFDFSKYQICFVVFGFRR